MFRWFYIAISVAVAAVWFGCAFGWIDYKPWFVTMAFIIIGVDCLLDAVRKFVEEA